MSRIRLQGALVFLVSCLVALSISAQQREPLDAYRGRRAALQEKLRDGLVVLFGNTEGPGSEAYFVFRQESNFYYLTGFAEHGAALLLAPAAEPGRSSAQEERAQLPHEILFLPARNPREEVWSGPQWDPQDPSTAARAGFAAVREIGSLESELRRYGKFYRTIYTLLPNPQGSEAEAALARERVVRWKQIVPSAEVRDVRGALADLRQIKSQTELDLIRRAVDCTVEAHRAAGRELRPGLFEYEVAAVMKYTFERRGCTGTAFDPLIGSGPRSVILHYIRNSERIEAGDVVVLDVGAEYGDYSADVTRTLPVNGRFTPRQREIYEIVLGAQEAAIQAVRPGIRLSGRGANSLFQIAYDYFNTHGKDQNGEPLGKYFTHGLGHSVGLDVHDAMDSSGVLQPGMVVTIEPGLYLPEENLGVRIEDMVLVTQDGHALLTERLPRTVEEVEQWMQK